MLPWRTVVLGLVIAASVASLGAQSRAATATPIQHVVVIFGENVSFDHYFGTYPNAANPPGEPAFTALPKTPSVNGLTAALLTDNPNRANPANGSGAANPFRLDRSQALTASQNHGYLAEQRAFDNGLMDLFPKFTGRTMAAGGTGPFYTTGLVMGYYDGNTVTALWHYAQHFALNDNSFSPTFGPSTPGAINLISGQTNGATNVVGTSPALVNDGQGGWTMIGDVDPAGDVCSSRTSTVSMKGRNIGDLLNAKNVTWGWFEGGFDLEVTNANGTTGCLRSSFSPTIGSYKVDYVPHHQPFQYYPSTANPTHLRPTSVAAIGSTSDGGANHQYDMNDFYAAVSEGHLPAVSFLKAPAYQNAHPANSDPLDEQVFVTTVINFLERRPEWQTTAVILAYDDSDGWYDHVSKIVNPSQGPADGLSGVNACGSGVALAGVNGSPVQGRCGYGPRLPLLVISPYAKSNHVDHTLTDQTSVLRFIEDNWLGGERIGRGSFDARSGSINGMFDFSRPKNPPLLLDGATGLPASVVAELGRKIFFDRSLSGSGRLACASCHSPSHAYGPPNGLAVQLGGPDGRRPGARAVPSLSYLERNPTFTIGPTSEIPDTDAPAGPAPAAGGGVPQGGLDWDGRADTLQDQAAGPFLDPHEMGNGSAAEFLARLQRTPYAGDFLQLFGPRVFAEPGLALSEALFALARFQLEDPSFHPYDSKYDRYLAGMAMLTAQEQRGLELFENPRKGNCSSCHVDKPSRDGAFPAAFTDYQFEALGAPRNPEIRATSDPDYYDLGLCGPARKDYAAVAAYCGLFKTPTLRNVATRSTFFHNGVFHSLDDVLHFYVERDTNPGKWYPKKADGAIDQYNDLPPAVRGNVDRVDAPFDRKPGDVPSLNDLEIADVIAFLKTLTDGYR